MSLMIALAASAAQAAPVGPHADHVIRYSNNPQAAETQRRVGWADTVTVGDTVYVSGVIAGTQPTDKGLEPAFTRAFDHLTNILTLAGVSWADVVEVRSFHTDPAGQIDAMAAVKRRYRAAPDPAWTAVGTPALLSPGGIAEIALIAHKPKRNAK